MPPKGRKRQMSQKALNTNAKRLGENSKQREELKLLKWCYEKMKRELWRTWAVRDLLLADEPGTEKLVEKPLNRGVQFIIGTNRSNGVGNWLHVAMLGRTLHVEVESIDSLENDKDIQHGVLFTMQKTLQTELPARQMVPSAVLDWSDVESAEMTEVVKELQSTLPAKRLDWNRAWGFFRMHQSDAAKDVFDAVVHARSLKMVVLDAQFHCSSGEVGATTWIEYNFIEMMAVMKGKKALYNLELHKLFPTEVQAIGCVKRGLAWNVAAVDGDDDDDALEEEIAEGQQLAENFKKKKGKVKGKAKGKKKVKAKRKQATKDEDLALLATGGDVAAGEAADLKAAAPAPPSPEGAKEETAALKPAEEAPDTNTPSKQRKKGDVKPCGIAQRVQEIIPAICAELKDFPEGDPGMDAALPPVVA